MLYCTEAESSCGYDIAVVESKRKIYTLYRSYLTPSIDLFDEYCASNYLCRSDFEKMLKRLKKVSDYDVYGYDPNRWERFYTTSKSCNLVDVIEIDKLGKRYCVELNTDISNTDGYDRFEIPIKSSYVSRLIFDILREGVSSGGFLQKEEV